MLVLVEFFWGNILMSSGLVILLIAGAVIVYAFAIYNSLVAKRVSVENSWSHIDVQLKRRHDLIPNLVETVKGYASHEKETLERVIQARNSAIAVSGSDNTAEKGRLEGALSGMLRQIFALSERYPDLKANQNFLSLQQELSTTENNISAVRQQYNSAVSVYNTSIQQVPANIVANFGGFSKKDFFELDAAEAEAVKQVPKVSF